MRHGDVYSIVGLTDERQKVSTRNKAPISVQAQRARLLWALAGNYRNRRAGIHVGIKWPREGGGRRVGGSGQKTALMDCLLAGQSWTTPVVRASFNFNLGELVQGLPWGKQTSSYGQLDTPHAIHPCNFQIQNQPTCRARSDISEFPVAMKGEFPHVMDSCTKLMLERCGSARQIKVFLQPKCHAPWSENARAFLPPLPSRFTG